MEKTEVIYEECSFQGCVRPRSVKGLCSSHYHQKARIGFLRPLPPIEVVGCAEPSCNRPARSRGLCGAHYEKIRPRKIQLNCDFEGCSKKAHASGLCSGHWHQRRKGRELTPIIRGKASRCAILNCERRPTNTEVCAVHRDTARRYSVTVDWLKTNLVSCATCGSRDRELHVDHDHDCCEGRKSCGECVRGVLCESCNMVLGRVNDDREVLKAMIAYLDTSAEAKAAAAARLKAARG